MEVAVNLEMATCRGDMWLPRPTRKDHPWRSMPWHAMPPHASGTTLSARARYAAGVREMFEGWLDGEPIRDENLLRLDLRGRARGDFDQRARAQLQSLLPVHL